ncbi:hypothetical protein HKW97_17765 [Pseudomonas luteola]|uniref:hypothetical protein n=1 Tax=Pseudomonas luteola TaxID=47886 RepID=UPI00389089C9
MKKDLLSIISEEDKATFTRLAAIEKELLEERKPIFDELLKEEPIQLDPNNLSIYLKNNKKLIPIIIKHIKLSYSDKTRAYLARALAFSGAKPFWSDLVKVYKATPEGRNEESKTRYEAKDAIASTLAQISDKSHVEELIELVLDPANGKSRIMLLRAFKKIKDEKCISIIKELSEHPLFEKEIKSWKIKKFI